MTTRLAREARELYQHAYDLMISVDEAERRLDDSQAGWPTSTPGATPATAGPPSAGRCDEITGRHYDTHPASYTVCGNPLPCPDHPTYATSIVERTAHNDRDRRLLDQLRREVHAALPPTKRAARIATANGTPRLDATTITPRLGEADTGIWCTNCVRHGYRNPRIEGEQYCSFCGDFRRYWLRDDNGKPVDAPKDVLDLRSAKSRLYETDITRILARLGVAWKHPKRKKAS